MWVKVPAVVVLNWTSAQNGTLPGSGVTGLVCCWPGAVVGDGVGAIVLDVVVSSD